MGASSAKAASRRRRAFTLAGSILILAAMAAGGRWGWTALEAFRGYRAWVREPTYVRMRDGTAIAVDVYRPARGGAPVSEPLPVLLIDYRYQRALFEDGRLRTPLEGIDRYRSFIKHGYVVAVADVRGAGASFGVSNGPFAGIEVNDTYDLVEWLAAQPWSSGAVGMFGSSYSGTVQMLAAAAAPPHLKAIFPEMFIFDLYDVAYPGGVPRAPFVREWSKLVERLDGDGRVAPVPEGSTDRLADALAEHRSNVTPFQLLEQVPYRDSRAKSGEPIFETRSPSRLLDLVNAADVPVYELSGFNDLWPKDAMLWFRNLRVPKKITIGPWSHNDRAGFDHAAEQLRWFDHWLKHADNDVLQEPPVRYYTSGARPGWRVASGWPPPAASPQTFALCTSSSEPGLCPRTPAESGRDEYRVDYEASSGTASRWANGSGARFGYPDMAGNDAKLLVYTSPPLDAEIEATGHPVVQLWITADVADLDLVLYLEDVEPGKGGSGTLTSRYVTEGVLRASHRRLSTPSFDNLSLPFHPSREEDSEALPPGEPTELRLDLLPISYRFGAGHRIRLAVAGADRYNLEARFSRPPPVMHVHWGGPHPSSLVLPVVPPNDVRLEAKISAPGIPRISIVAAGLLALGSLLYGTSRPSVRRWLTGGGRRRRAALS